MCWSHPALSARSHCPTTLTCVCVCVCECPVCVSHLHSLYHAQPHEWRAEEAVPGPAGRNRQASRLGGRVLRLVRAGERAHTTHALTQRMCSQHTCPHKTHVLTQHTYSHNTRANTNPMCAHNTRAQTIRARALAQAQKLLHTSTEPQSRCLFGVRCETVLLAAGYPSRLVLSHLSGSPFMMAMGCLSCSPLSVLSLASFCLCFLMSPPQIVVVTQS